MYAPGVRARLGIDDAKVSIGLARSLYARHDAQEDDAVRFVCRLFEAVLAGNRWAQRHAPRLLPAAVAVITAADAACDAALGSHLPEALDALNGAQTHLAALIGSAVREITENEQATAVVATAA